MLQRILGGVLVLLGLVAVALGVASATVWRDSDTVVATAEPVGDGTMVVTDPGVLGLVSGDVTVSAKGPEGQPVTLVVGRDVDVLGWIGKDPYSRVTGLEDWDTLGVEAGAAEETPKGEKDAEKSEAAPSGADPAGNDMWVAQTSDDGSATLRWSDRPGRWTLLAAGVGKDAQAPTLELTWPRTVTTPYLWPAVGAGAVLVVLGGLLFVLGTRRARSRRDDAPRRGTGAASPTGTAAEGPDAAAGDDAAPAGSNPFVPVSATAWSPASDTSSDTPSDGSDGSSDLEADAASDEDGPSGSGTAEVPMAGRLLRRSRRRAAAPQEPDAAAVPDAAPAGWAAPGADAAADPATAWSPAVAPVPAEAPADAPAPSAPEARPATGATPHLSRRELRAQEEARRAAEQGGVTRMLRAITGSIPAVRPQAPDAPAAPAQDHDLSTPAGRAAAWRATWGFGQTPGGGSAGPDDHRPTDGENR